MITIQKAISLGGTVAFIVLVIFLLAYSIPIITNWAPIIGIIYLLSLYSILYPLALPMIPSKIAYYGYIPASFFGLEVSLTFWLNRFGMLVTHILLGSVLLTCCLLFLFHHFTRQGLMIHREFLYGGLGLDLKRMTRVGGGIIAPFFLVMSMTFSNPESMSVADPGPLIVVSVLIFLYLAFSVLGLNVAFRTELLNKKLGAKDFASKLTHLERELFNRHPRKRQTVNFLSFVLRSSVNDFIYGDYDRSFLDSYRIIHDTIIRNPKAIVEKKADEKTLDEYRRIRVFLVHGFLKEKKSGLEVPIQVEDVVWARKVLFQKTIDLIELAYYVTAEI